MAASVISRATWTDGVGGTVINNARLQGDVYDKIDALIAATITFGNLLKAEGFGTHGVSAGGTGTMRLQSRNTTAGTGNAASVDVGNDLTSLLGQFKGFSSTFTTSGASVASGVSVLSTGVGGLSLQASDASGTVRIYPNDAASPILTVASSVITSAIGVLVSTSGSGSAYYSLNRTDNGSNEKRWFLRILGSDLRIETSDDAVTGATSVMTFTRTGTTPTSINAGADVLPLATSTYDLGSTSLKWAEVHGALVTSDDLAFANGWTATEHDRVGIDRPGIAFLDQHDVLRMFIDDAGSLYVSDVRKLDELPYTQTTREQRLAMRPSE